MFKEKIKDFIIGGSLALLAVCVDIAVSKLNSREESK